MPFVIFVKRNFGVRGEPSLDSAFKKCHIKYAKDRSISELLSTRKNLQFLIYIKFKRWIYHPQLMIPTDFSHREIKYLLSVINRIFIYKIGHWVTFYCGLFIFKQVPTAGSKCDVSNTFVDKIPEIPISLYCIFFFLSFNIHHTKLRVWTFFFTFETPVWLHRNT